MLGRGSAGRSGVGGRVGNDNNEFMSDISSFLPRAAAGRGGGGFGGRGAKAKTN